MPTNLPAEYYEVEERYKAAESPAERVRLLEELISTVPKHKGTDKLRAEMRRRLSRLKSSTQAKSKVSRHESTFHIDKEGAGQVVIIGATNRVNQRWLSLLPMPTSRWLPILTLIICPFRAC
jgi:ribosome-interacting GTPase 1